jgi:molecular chaperone GrpE (heat shock protein)
MTQQEEQKNSTKAKVQSTKWQQTDWIAEDSAQQELTTKIFQLEKELAEQKEITKRAQYDYINLKADFDRRQRLKEEEWKTAHIDTLITSVQKFFAICGKFEKISGYYPSWSSKKMLLQKECKWPITSLSRH